MFATVARGFAAWLLVMSLPAAAEAQPVFESAGERALGMGGAFVAVSDDATSSHWNPAGLASGGPAGMTIGWYRFELGDGDSPARGGAQSRRGSHTSLGTWPLGLSFGTFRFTRLIDLDEGAVGVETLRTSQFGVTILQTIVQGLTVGSTLRYVRGDVVSVVSDRTTVAEALSATDDLEGPRSGAFDLDLGLMADMRRLRIGFTMKNLRTPTFGDASAVQITLPRQARLGLAILPLDGLTLAMDLDLETVDLLGDRRRNAVVGGEARLAPRLTVRSGARWSLEGASRLLGSAGVSLGLRPGLWLDGHYSYSRADDVREFGVALRAGM
jgi:hypothetical protein